VVWYPIYGTLRAFLEGVQRRYLKYVLYRREGTYPVRGIDYQILLDGNEFESLENRRKQISVKFLYGLLGGNVDCAELLAGVGFRVPRLGSRSAAPFVLPAVRTNIGFRAPLYHMCANANAISVSII